MNETRREILEKLKYLRKNWKITLKTLYPKASLSVYDGFNNFIVKEKE